MSSFDSTRSTMLLIAMLELEFLRSSILTWIPISAFNFHAIVRKLKQTAESAVNQIY